MSAEKCQNDKRIFFSGTSNSDFMRLILKRLVRLELDSGRREAIEGCVEHQLWSRLLIDSSWLQNIDTTPISKSNVTFKASLWASCCSIIVVDSFFSLWQQKNVSISQEFSTERTRSVWNNRFKKKNHSEYLKHNLHWIHSPYAYVLFSIHTSRQRRGNSSRNKPHKKQQ